MKNPLRLIFKTVQPPAKPPPYLSVPEPDLKGYEWRQDATVRALMDACGLEEMPDGPTQPVD